MWWPRIQVASPERASKLAVVNTICVTFQGGLKPTYNF